MICTCWLEKHLFPGGNWEFCDAPAPTCPGQRCSCIFTVLLCPFPCHPAHWAALPPPSSTPGAGGSGLLHVCGAALPPTCRWLSQGPGHPIMSISISITALGMAQLGEMVPLTLQLCASVWLGCLLPVCSQVLCGLWCSPGTPVSWRTHLCSDLGGTPGCGVGKQGLYLLGQKPGRSSLCPVCEGRAALVPEAFCSYMGDGVSWAWGG